VNQNNGVQRRRCYQRRYRLADEIRYVSSNTAKVKLGVFVKIVNSQKLEYALQFDRHGLMLRAIVSCPPFALFPVLDSSENEMENATLRSLHHFRRYG
jgi:hypothetical protein